MKQVLAVVGALVGVVLLFVVLGSLAFGAKWLGLEWRGFWGPREAAVERQIFEETQSYNHGMIQQLAKHRLEYLREEDPDAKAAIASTVRMQFAQFDIESLPQPELREFWYEVNH